MADCCLSPETVLCAAAGLDFVLVSENELLVQFGTCSRTPVYARSRKRLVIG